MKRLVTIRHFIQIQNHLFIPSRLNYGKTVTAVNAEHVVSEPSDLLPAGWLFIRGNPFCGRDRDGNGALIVEASSLLTAGETLSTLMLHDGNDLPRGLTWSETVYAPTDGISLVDAHMQGTGEYVLVGSSCSPPEYTVTVDDILASFAGYTFTPEGQAVFYLGSDTFFDYQYRDYVGTWHGGNYLEISHTVSAAGKGFISELIDLDVAPTAAPEPAPASPMAALHTVESIAETVTPVVPIVSQWIDNSHADDDSIATTSSAPAVDLLAESFSVNSYIPVPQPILVGLPGTTFHRAATSEYDLRPLGDDLLSDGTDDMIDDGLRVLIDVEDSLDLLAESAVTVPL